MNIQKSSLETPLVTIKRPGYGFPCICAVLLLLYAQGALNTKFNSFFLLLGLAFWGIVFFAYLRHLELRNDFKHNFPSGLLFNLSFDNAGFSYGYENRIKTVVPYGCIIN